MNRYHFVNIFIVYYLKVNKPAVKTHRNDICNNYNNGCIEIDSDDFVDFVIFFWFALGYCQSWQ